jgi:hypothetical protein
VHIDVDAYRDAMGDRNRAGLVALILGSLISTAACSSLRHTTKFGIYKAHSVSGQVVTVTLDSRQQRARLSWVNGSKTYTDTANTSNDGARMVLDFGPGLHVDLLITANDQFQLTYPQYPDGEPEAGEPAHTLNFALSSIS